MKKTIVRNIRAIIALVMIALCGVEASASTPWRVNPSDYRYDMSLYLSVAFAAADMDYSLYDVGVFCGDECRGVAEVLPLGDGTDCLYVRVRSNQESGETMTFRYYDRASGEIAPVEGVSFPFLSNSRLGYPSDPYAVKIIRHYDVAIEAGMGGSVNNEGGRVAEQTELILEATPDEGYHFEKWSDDSTENPRSVVVADNISLAAEFGVNQYQLTYLVDDAPYKEYTVDYGTALTAEAEPTKEGHTFSGWDEVPATMPARDVTVTGSFAINSYNAVFKIGEDVIETVTVVFGQLITAPEAPAKEGHTFAGWTEIPETMPAHDIEIRGSYTVNQYKLNYVVDDAPYMEYTVDYGTALTAEAEPTKEGHTFSGWDEVPATMPARDVTVTGSFSINSYNAVFKIGEDVIETVTVVFGQPITAPEAPAKEGHTFAGWGEIPATMPAGDIEIRGSYTVNQYKLNYVVDDATYKEYTVDYGTALTAEAEPTKEGHTFSGWDEVPATMPARDVTVTGSFAINSYNAVFMIGEDLIETVTVVFGQPITAPEAPAKEGHTFAGWGEIPETMPAGDIEIWGSYTVNQYKLNYVVDDAPYKEYTVDYGTALTAEAEPTKEGHTFSGWDEVPSTMPARDVTVSGSFAINSYNAVFMIGEDLIETVTVVFGQPITAPEASAKEGHTFAGWGEIPATMPAHDIEIRGSYTVNEYKLTYIIDGEKHQELSVPYGTVLEALVPEKEGHTFSGWDNVPATMPAEDITLTGTFTVNSYNAVFKIGEDVIETISVVYGQSVTAPEAPAKEGHTFAGWTEIPETMPAKDIEVRGSYTVNEYKLTYVIDGEKHQELSVPYGTVLEALVPEKEGHTFSGWDNVPATMPAEDITLTGTFTVNSYNAVFMIGEDVIETVTVVFGQPITAPEAPAKEGHTFAGWTEIPETMPAKDIEIRGSYTVNEYKLTYVIDGEKYQEMSVPYGTVLEALVPEKEGHTFSGWDNVPATMPAEDITLTGTFTVNSYNTVFKIGEEVIETISVVYGQSVTAPEAPAKEGHTFTGWGEIPETMPAKDIEIRGSYTVNEYKLTYIIDGEKHQELSVPYGTVLEALVPEKEGHTFSGWDNVIETMPAHDVTLTGSFTINSYKLTLYLNGEEYKTMEIEYGQPLDIEDPEVPADHRFDGWQEEIPATMPANDLEIHGTYSAIVAVASIEVDSYEEVTVLTTNGVQICKGMKWYEVTDRLVNGLYIINGKKVFVRR